MKTNKLRLFGLVLIPTLALPLAANPVSGELFYTRFSGAPNVKKVSFAYDGAASFVLGTPSVIGTTPGADGIVGNPQNSNLLIVGGQGPLISTIDRTSGAVTPYPTPVAAFHLAVPDSTTLLASGIPGGLSRHTILPGGSLSLGTTIALAGHDTSITSVISAGSAYYYTTSGPSGFGSFGTLAFNAPVGTATSAVTTRLFAGVVSAHGGAYDPFTGDVMLFGSSRIGQYDILTNTLVEKTVAGGLTFDQGAVDGQGHMFVASNTGHLFFMDYSATSDVLAPTNFQSTQFLDSNLDDVAPLIGTGGTSNVPDGGSTVALLACAFGALLLPRRRAS